MSREYQEKSENFEEHKCLMNKTDIPSSLSVMPLSLFSLIFFRFNSSFGGRDYRQQNKPKPQQGYGQFGAAPAFNPMNQYSNYGGSYGGSYNNSASSGTDWWGN